MDWKLITDIILIAAIATAAVFGVLALYQWIKRKSFTKIDPELRWATIPLLLMAATYFIFDHILIWNTRPNGSGEPSFPSSHVMLVATVFAIVAIILPRYIKSDLILTLLYAIMLTLTATVAVGRVLANMHWPSDVAGALIFSAIFALIYYLIIKKVAPIKSPSHNTKHKEH